MMKKYISCLIYSLVYTVIFFSVYCYAQDDFTRALKRYPYNLRDTTVIGSPTWAIIKEKDTLLDVARRYGLSYYNELELMYPKIDEWMPPRNKPLVLPTIWILPTTRHEQLVINLPEQRLFYFTRSNASVQTFPIGIGDEGWETPLGTFYIFDKREKPTWYIPKSLQEKYGMKMMPPGPDNPMGDYVMKFSAGAYGVHGTNMPWGVGGLVSHGCIRLYPEDIQLLYSQVKIGTKLEIIYEPVKLGQRNGHIFIEAHPDIYKRIPDYPRYALEKLRQFPLAYKVDFKRFQLAIFLQNGLVTDITRLSLNDTFEREIIDRMVQ